MQISELSKKGMKVSVRVPAKQKAKLGEHVTGEFAGLKRNGRVVTVNVMIKGKKHGFRPQDVEKA